MFMETQLQSRIKQMYSQNPEAYKKMTELIKGKNEGEIKNVALNLAKERGVDLANFANQFGIKL